MAAVNTFDRTAFLIDEDNKFNLFKFDMDITLLRAIGTHIVKDEEIDKPWLIAYRIYGQSRLWWFIMKYNRIKRFDQELESGMALKYPDITDYYALYDRYSRI